jgi:hypothetical protein
MFVLLQKGHVVEKYASLTVGVRGVLMILLQLKPRNTIIQDHADSKNQCRKCNSTIWFFLPAEKK